MKIKKVLLKNNIFLSIIFITMSFFSAVSIYAIEKSLKLELNVNDFFQESSLDFQIEGLNNGKDNDVLNLDYQYMIIKNYIGGFGEYGIYFSGDLSREPEMLTGRFFEENDFSKGEKLVVVGKNLQDEIVVNDGEDYYYILGEYYKVIGVMGDEKKETSYDSNVYINLDSILGNEKTNSGVGDYTLQSHGENEAIFSEIKSIYEDEAIKTNSGENQSPISKVLNNIDVYSVNNIIKVIVILILNVSLITIYWMKEKSRAIGIKRAMGASKNKIKLEVLKELSKISVISFVIGYLLYIFTVYFRDGYVEFYFYTIGIVFAITCITTLVSAGISIYKINKMEPAKIMRC